jgi:hypothetical protein
MRVVIGALVACLSTLLLLRSDDWPAGASPADDQVVGVPIAETVDSPEPASPKSLTEPVAEERVATDEDRAETTPARVARQPRAPGGIWVGRDELLRRPVLGEEWERVSTDAARPFGRADISDQDSNHDVYTLAAALTCVRIEEHCDKARQGVLDAIGTESRARWLAVGRNLGSYVIAADLLDLREGGPHGQDGVRVQRWMEEWTERLLPDNNTGLPRSFAPFRSGANAAAQEGFVYAALAAYLGDTEALARAWDAFRAFVCDPTAPDPEMVDLRRPVRDGWTHDDRRPCAINPLGAVKVVGESVNGADRLERIDGALVADMRRGGRFQASPLYTQYPWVGLEGLVPAALILERAGYPAFAAADRAVLRALEYLWHLRAQTGDARWFDGERARAIVHLVNVQYDVSFPVARATGAGRTIGYTGWTHPAR